jgi:uncharacterized Zn finger protein (UPF0148 family)
MTLAARQAQDDARKTCENCGKKAGWFRLDGRLLCGDCDKEARSPKKEELVQSKPLFLPETSDQDIEQDIREGIGNLAQQEVGTRWMREGAPLTGNSTTDQMLGAGLKAIIDQNKVIIRQNELLRRQARRSQDSPKT